ncbi:MAG: hypothetical protein R2713_00135 [Ilumatobacteraceae bacterium]
MRHTLTESIVDPHAKQVAGYPQLMPEVALTEQDVAAIVQYIVELATRRHGHTLDRTRGDRPSNGRPQAS